MRLNSARHAASTSGSAIQTASYAHGCLIEGGRQSRAPAAHHRTDGVHRGHHLIVRNRKPDGGKGDFAGRADKTSRPPPPRPEPGQAPGVPAWATGRQDHTMPRAYWKGYLRLSLVTCPIELFPATSQAEKTHFHQINTQTGHRLRQQMVDEETGRVVDAGHKGRGYELTKGKFVEIDEDELKAIQVESTHTVDIDGFVPRADIDKRYLDKPYYIAPNGKTGAEAFVVIRDAMQDEERVALARIVMAHREHMIMLEPLGKGLLGTTLRFDYEVRSEKEYFSHIPSPRISKDMVSLASHILETKAAKFDPGKFKDEYETALRKLVQRKAKGHTIEAPEPEERPSNVINLMDALRESLKTNSKRAHTPGASRKKPPRARRRKAV
jgi:DNA end-binding protein Ku